MRRLVRPCAVVLAVVLAHGAVAHRALARQYTLTAIPRGDFDQVVPDDLNSAGQVVGRLIRAGEPQHGYVWSAAGGLTDLGANVYPFAIGDQGTVVGQILGGEPFIWTRAQGVRSLSSLPGGAPFSRSTVWDVNASGQVLGLSSDAQYQAFVYNPNGTIRKLPLPTQADGLPFDYAQTATLTNAGDAVGWTSFYSAGNRTFHGTVWPAAGGVRLLENLPGSALGSQANTINARGQVTGEGMPAAGPSQHPVLWGPDGHIIDLGLLPGKTTGGTSGINDLGEVVGYSGTDDPQEDRAFLWTESEGLLDLNSLLDASGAGWTLTSPEGINDAGQILTAGFFDGQYRTALLTPLVPEPSALAFVGIVAAAALMRPRRRDIGAPDRGAAGPAERLSVPARGRGFTLVELLVVVGIVSTLVALLMPALGRARRQANNAVCLNNLRQFGVAYQAAAVENHGKSPRGDLGPVLHVLMSKCRPDQDQPVPLCPEAAELSNRRWNRGQYDALLGTATRAWGEDIIDHSFKPAGVWWPGLNGCSYGANNWAVSTVQSAHSTVDPWITDRLIYPTTTDGSRVPVIADGMEERGWPLETDTPPNNLIAPNLLDPTREGFGMRMFCMARHGRAINIVFLDGHAATTPLEDLWKLRWHNQWVLTDVTLPAK